MRWMNLTNFLQHAIHIKTTAGVNLSSTVSGAIYYCGLTDGALFNGNTKADRMDAELFDYDFSSCMKIPMRNLTKT